MPELRRALRWDEACLTLLIAAGSAAFASAHLGATPWAGLLVLPLFAVSVPRVPEGIRQGLPRAMTGLLATTLLFGLVWALYPVLSGAVVRIVPRALGFALGALALTFLAGSSVWKPSATALPSALGLMTVAAYNPDALIAVPVAVGALAVFLYLVGPKAWPRALRLGVFAAAFLALASGIIRALPWAQPKVEAAAASVINAGLETSSGLNLDSSTRLGDVQRLALSRRVALRVFTPRPQKLRARVFTRFDGARWSVENGAPARQLVEAAPPADFRAWLDALPGRSLSVPGATIRDGTVPTKVLQLAPTDKALPAPVGVKLVRVSGAGVAIDRDGLMTPSRGSGVEIYGLLNDPRDTGGEPNADALAVPAETDPRFRELASKLAQGATPDERVQRTVDHLGRECRYSLEVGRFRTRQPIAEFLFEKKRGYCEYFASAAALLLRLEGVPTRYVTGFNVPGAERAGDHYVVRESDAHAWIEAYLPGRGFVEVDPTPADQYAEVHGTERGWAAWEWVQARWGELLARLRAGDPVAMARWALGRVGVPLALLGLALGARRFLRRGGKRSRAPARTAPDQGLPRELARLLGRLDRHWTRQGAARPPSRAPLEHLEALPPETAGGDASRRVVAALYAARFAGVRIAPADVLALGRLLDEGGIR